MRGKKHFSEIYSHLLKQRKLLNREKWQNQEARDKIQSYLTYKELRKWSCWKMISPQISQMLELNQGFNVAIRGIVSKVNQQQQMFQCMRISTEKKNENN